MTAKLIKRNPKHAGVISYSPTVREKLDPSRPKYNEAVKSLAAFAPDERKFNVLVSHLDAACGEAMDYLDDYGQYKRS